MRLTIADVLSPAECAALCDTLRPAGLFEDGGKTAGWHARAVKHNLQGRDCAEIRAVSARIEQAVMGHPLFQVAARPKSLPRLTISRYEPGMELGPHTDDALMNGARTDLSFTLMLSDADDYDGGALIVDGAEGEEAIRPPAGALYLYPSSTLHRVASVTRGTRLAAVGWVRSFIREPDRRELLFDLERALRAVFEADGKTETFDLLAKTRSNLLRMWAED